MTIAFVSNYMNHYQIYLCDELYKLTNGDFYFIEDQMLPNSLREGGFPELERTYIIRAWQGNAETKRALTICKDVDVLIAGGGKFILKYIKDRLNEGKLTFEYAERALKQGWINFFSPTNLKLQFYYHLYFYNKPYYKLCASAFAARDMYLQHSFIGKCLKFGYFPQILDDKKNLINAKGAEKKLKIFWCARFIKWKHPELAVKLAEILNSKGYDFDLNMIGSGVLFEDIKSMVFEKKLSHCVHLLGNFTNDEVLKLMSEHHLFLFTSDKNEGWGVVLNEAMGQGCCPVASHLIGSVPYLLKHRNNGMIFESGNLDSLVDNVEYLLNNRQELKSMSICAHNTLINNWTPQIAAKRLIVLVDELLKGNNSFTYEDGPLSRALPITETYYN